MPRLRRGAGALSDGGTRDVFVTDVTNYTIRRITWDGLVTTLAGAAGQRKGKRQATSGVLPEGSTLRR